MHLVLLCMVIMITWKNAMIKKQHKDTERIDLFSLFYCFVVKNFEFRSM